MSGIYVLNKAEQIMAVLENKTGGESCPYWEAVTIEQLNGEYRFEFQTMATHPDAVHLVTGNKLGVWAQNTEFHLYEITNAEDTRDGGVIKYVTAEHSVIAELNSDIVRDKRPVNTTAGAALTSVLTDTVGGGTRWAAGNIAPLGTATPENIYYETPMAGVQKVIAGFKTDYKPRFTLSEGYISNRYIDLGPRGSDTGRRFEYTKDLQEITRQVDASGLKTAMVGRGKGEESGDGYGRRIDFSDVVWSVANGDPVDKPAGQDWVGDPAALINFGDANGTRHKFGVFEEQDEEDPAALLQKTWEYLQQVNEPRISYTAKIMDIAALTGLEYQKIRMGDTIAIIDREFTPPIQVRARVIDIKRPKEEPEKTEILLGNYIPLFTDDSGKLEELERVIKDRAGVWDANSGPITPGDFEDIVPEVVAEVSAVGLFKSIMVDWAFISDINIAQYEVYGSKVSGFTPDTAAGSNRLFRGLAGGFVHDAQTNEQWYFKVRAVNQQGTAGPFSAQVSGTTVRIAAGDVTPLIITNEMIAASAAIDFAKIANVSITNAMIANLAVDTGKIGNLAVTTAKIANLAVDNAKIKDLHASKINAGVIDANLVEIANSKIRLSGNGIAVYRNGVIGATLMDGSLGFNDTRDGEAIGKFAATFWRDTGVKGISLNMEQNRYISFGRYVDSTIGYGSMMTLNPGSAIDGAPNGINMNLPVRMDADHWMGPYSLRFGLNNTHNQSTIWNDGTNALAMASYGGIRLMHIFSGGATADRLTVDSNSVDIWQDLDMHNWKILRASNVTVTSFEEEKTDIQVWQESALNLIRGAKIHDYELLNERKKGNARRRQGLVIGSGYDTPAQLIEPNGLELYTMIMWAWKAIQELDKTQTGPKR